MFYTLPASLDIRNRNVIFGIEIYAVICYSIRFDVVVVGNLRWRRATRKIANVNFDSGRKLNTNKKINKLRTENGFSITDPKKNHLRIIPFRDLLRNLVEKSFESSISADMKRDGYNMKLRTMISVYSMSLFSDTSLFRFASFRRSRRKFCKK